MTLKCLDCLWGNAATVRVSIPSSFRCLFSPPSVSLSYSRLLILNWLWFFHTIILNWLWFFHTIILNWLRFFHTTMPRVLGSQDSFLVKRQNGDRKVASSSPGRSSGRIVFSIVNFLCRLLFSVCSTPVSPQRHVKDPGHSAKSAGHT